MTHALEAVPATGPQAVATPDAGRRRRAEVRRQQRRRRARRRAAVLSAVLGAAVVLLAGWLVLRPDGPATPADADAEPAVAPAAAGGELPAGEVVAVHLVDDTGGGIATALVAATATPPSGTAVVVPAGLVVDVAGAGRLPLGEAVAVRGGEAASGALGDLLGVAVSDTWVLRTDELAALVDQVGGVAAEVDAPVPGTDEEGHQVVVAPAGAQTLGGEAALAWLRQPAVAGQVDPTRVRAVLQAVVAGMPPDVAAAAPRLAALAGAPDRLPELVATLSAATAAGDLTWEQLPVRPLDAGSGEALHGLADGAADVLEQAFPLAATAPAGSGARVYVENGVGTPGLVDAARTVLVERGHRFLNGGNAAHFRFEATLVVLPDASPESLALGTAVAEALGLPEPQEALRVTSRGQNVADVVVILGADFAPGAANG